MIRHSLKILSAQRAVLFSIFRIIIQSFEEKVASLSPLRLIEKFLIRRIAFQNSNAFEHKKWCERNTKWGCKDYWSFS